MYASVTSCSDVIELATSYDPDGVSKLGAGRELYSYRRRPKDTDAQHIQFDSVNYPVYMCMVCIVKGQVIN